MENRRAGLVGVMKQLVSRYGADLLKDAQRVNALLMDCLPQDARDRKLIVAVLKENIGAKLLASAGRSEQEQILCVKRCKRQLKDDTWLDEEASEFAVEVIAEALGISTKASVRQVILEDLVFSRTPQKTSQKTSEERIAEMMEDVIQSIERRRRERENRR